MIFGMSTATYTLVHIVLSLVGIGSGFVVFYGLLSGRRLDRWTALFLTTTVLTSVTGYGFPVEHVMPSHIVGAISLVALAIAIFARYGRHLSGIWRSVYVVTATLALYLNVFVAIVQSFLKVPALKALAPKGNEPPFLVTQLFVLTLLLVLSVFAVKKFRVEPVRVTARAA